MKNDEKEPTGRWGDLMGDVNRARARYVERAKRLQRWVRLIRYVAPLVAAILIGLAVLSLRMHKSVLAGVATGIAVVVLIAWAYVIPALQESVNADLEQYRRLPQ